MLRRDTKLPDRTTLVDYRGGPAAVAVSRSCSCQASTPSVTHSYKLDEPTMASIQVAAGAPNQQSGEGERSAG
jgi:hypothetical protein